MLFFVAGRNAACKEKYIMVSCSTSHVIFSLNFAHEGFYLQFSYSGGTKYLVVLLVSTRLYSQKYHRK